MLFYRRATFLNLFGAVSSMNNTILLAFVAGSAANLALEDVFSPRKIPTYSGLAHMFLIFVYVFSAHGFIWAFGFILFLAILYLTKQKYIGLGDAGAFLFISDYEPFILTLAILPGFIVEISRRENKHEMVMTIALYIFILTLVKAGFQLPS